jgi:pyruvate dehydrogenase E1 component beta subunit
MDKNMAKITVREALNRALEEEMNHDKNVLIMGEEVAEYQGAYKITQGLLQKFGPKRVIDTPITEYGFTGIAVGAAFMGLRPVVEFMSFNFSMQAIDHIVNSAAKTLYMSGGQISCPIVFRGPNGVASQVGAQHSQNFAAWYSHVPGLKVVAPYSAEDAYGMLKAAIRDPNPVIFLEHEMLYGESFEVPDNMEIVPFGKGKIINEGEDVTIVTFSLQVKIAIEAAKELLGENIKAEIIDLRSIKPLDEDIIIESVKKTGRLVIIEEGWYFGGVAASIASIVSYKAFDYFDAPIEIVCGVDVPMPYATNLEKMSIPSVADVIKAVKKVCYK